MGDLGFGYACESEGKGMRVRASEGEGEGESMWVIRCEGMCVRVRACVRG